MTTKRILLNLTLALGFMFLLTPKTEAVYCSGTTISGTCEFQHARDGFDSGNTTNDQPLTVSSGTLVIGGSVANQELAVGKLVLSGGAVTIYEGAKLRLGVKIWMVDADADGYAASTTQYIQESAPAGGRRKSAILSSTVVDCDDTQTDVRPNQAAYFSTAVAGGGPKAGTFDYNCDGLITKENNDASAYSCNTSGCADHYYTVVSGWADGSNPACGTTEAYYSASYGTCSALSACSYTSSNATQRCK